MKATKALALAVVLAVVTVVVGCSKVEKILPKKDGLWNVTSSHSLTYLNDTLTSDTTITDSLGSIFFANDGTGYTQETGSAVKDNFTWSVDDQEEYLTITSTDSGAVPMSLQILESSKKEMTLFQNIESGAAPFLFRFEITSVITRAE